jgi:hypothetical protein
MSYYSKVFYTVNSTTQSSKQYTIQFGLESGTATTNNRPYIHTSHIKVKVDGVATTDFTISEATNPSRLTFNEGTTLTVGSTIEIYRETPRAAASRPVDFEDASVLTESDLDLAAIGGLYITQEIIDRLENMIPDGGNTSQLLAKKSSADYDIEWVNNALVEVEPDNAGGILTWNGSGEPTIVTPDQVRAYVPRVPSGPAGPATLSPGGIIKVAGNAPADTDGDRGDLWIYYGSGGVDPDGHYPGDVFLKIGDTNWAKLYNYTGIGGGDTTTGVSRFTDLTDTPESTDQQSEKFVYVKPNGDIGFKNSGRIGYLDDVTYNAASGPTTGDVLVWDGALASNAGVGAWTLSPGIQTEDLDELAKGSVLSSNSSSVMSPVTPGSSGLFLKSNLSTDGGVEWATGTTAGGGLSATALLVANNFTSGISVGSNMYTYPFLTGTLTDIADTPTEYRFTNWSLPGNRIRLTEAGMYRVQLRLTLCAVDAATGTTATEYPIRVMFFADTQNGAGYHLKDQTTIIVPSSGGSGPDTDKVGVAEVSYTGYLSYPGGINYPFFILGLQSAIPTGIALPSLSIPQSTPNPPVIDPGGNYYDERLSGLRILIEKF